MTNQGGLAASQVPLQGTVKGARRRGRQKKRWEDNIKELTGMGFGDDWEGGKLLLQRHL